MLFELSKKHPALNIQFDPTAFEKYGIDQVPALVVSDNSKFDVVFGNLVIEDGLSLINEHGDLKDTSL